MVGFKEGEAMTVLAAAGVTALVEVKTVAILSTKNARNGVVNKKIRKAKSANERRSENLY